MATADAARHRIERNLHDGAQQRLVSLAMDLRAAEADAAAGTGDLVQQLDHLATGIDGMLEDLREIACGLHPAILADGGLRPALKTLASRSAIPVDLDVEVDRRPPEPVEIAVYHTVAEALTNTVKHARGTAAEIEAAESDGVLHVRVRDNGRGGADFSHGSGLVGLSDRAESLGGHLQLHSPPAPPCRSNYPRPAIFSHSANWPLTRHNVGADRLLRVAVLPGGAGSDRITGEQAALRRVATLVARAAPPAEVFAAVTEEAGRLLHVGHAAMGRYDADGTITVVAGWDSEGPAFPVGSRWSIGGRNVPALVFQTGQPARMDDRAEISGPVAVAAHEFGLRAGVGVPVSVEGRLWGVMIVGSRAEPLSASTEERLAGFTELAATAIANAEARVELRGFAEEQAALRRVATLVAQSAPSAEVFAAVTEEAGRLLQTDHATMGRYDPDGTITAVATWSSTGVAVPVGTQHELGGQDLATIVFQTGRPARSDFPSDISGPIAEAVRKVGIRAAVGVPVSAEGRLWGIMVVESRAGPLPTGTEARLAGFTELAATAIANAEAHAALTASRARIVATADATRRRIERNLHDGAQQRLVSLALNLRAAQAAPPEAGELVQWLDGVVVGLDGVLDDLREIARGLHPAILADGGLSPAIKTLARRSAVPVDLDIQVDRRLPEPVETAAYYTVAEALTNATKHAHATAADIQAAESDGVLHVRIRDNGRGGADCSHGSGLLGLKDRAEALGGHLRLHSPSGAGTTVEIALPLHAPGEPALPPEAADPAHDASRAIVSPPQTGS